MLLVTATCISCEKQVNVLFSLTELFKQCPLPDRFKKAIADADKEVKRITDGKPKPSPFTEDDIKWLKEVAHTAIPLDPPFQPPA